MNRADYDPEDPQDVPGDFGQLRDRPIKPGGDNGRPWPPRERPARILGRTLGVWVPLTLALATATTILALAGLGAYALLTGALP